MFEMFRFLKHLMIQLLAASENFLPESNGGNFLFTFSVQIIHRYKNLYHCPNVIFSLALLESKMKTTISVDLV